MKKQSEKMPPPKIKQVSRTASSSKLVRTATMKALKTHATGRIDGADGVAGDDHEFHRLKSNTQLVPIDQLHLTPEELREDITKMLTTVDPHASSNLSEFSYKERAFVPVAVDAGVVCVLDIESAVIHKESEEAQMQMARFSGVSFAPKSVLDDDEDEKRESFDSGEPEAKEDGEETKVEDQEDDEIEEEVAGDDAVDGEGGDADDERKDSTAEMGPKKSTNQFNCCERAALTTNNMSRDLETQTYPPPRNNFSAQALQWIIFDAYHEDHERQQRLAEKEKEKKDIKVGAAPKKDEVRKKEVVEPDVSTKTLLAAKTLERMITQNTYDDIAQDYRYWEDPSDDYRDEEGTLLPLWKFQYEKTKKNSITDVCWNPCYYDLFAVAFGGFDFMKEEPEGAVCLFTLKNPSHPEFICQFESGVVCVDIHPKYPSLLAVGLYDGNVAVYNVQMQTKEPQYKSDSVEAKHAGTVWQVKWGTNLTDGEINFFSVAADGQVLNWVLMQNELATTVIIPLFLPSDALSGPDGLDIQLTGCGTTFAFHPTEPLIFLVGTEEGLIYKCSTAYSSMYLAAYEAHHMPVHKIGYNKFNPAIFLSCSADWRVKIWEDNRTEPLFEFDLAAPVGDVEWAPYSSTVFAAVTGDGRVHVFDLQVNKYKAICVQAVVSKKRNKLTRVAFNHKLPIVIVGDDRGCISSLKLSPNLRKKVKALKKGPTYTPRELEVQKLEKLLALVREPVTQPPSPDSGSLPSN